MELNNEVMSEEGENCEEHEGIIFFQIDNKHNVITHKMLEKKNCNK